MSESATDDVNAYWKVVALALENGLHRSPHITPCEAFSLHHSHVNMSTPNRKQGATELDMMWHSSSIARSEFK